MRVTSNTFADSLVNHLQMLARRQSALQTQIASGQRVQNAADDPLAAQEILALRDQSVATAQYEKNIGVHQEFATATHGAMSALNRILSRAREITVSVDDLQNPETLKAFAAEVGQMVQQAVHISNTQFRGEYIFAGTKSGTPAFTAEYETNGDVKSVSFAGSTSIPSSEIAQGIVVSSRMAGENRSGSGEVGLFADSRSGADLFGHLIALQKQLESADVDAIQATNDDLKKDEDHLLYQVASNGAFQSRLETMLSSNQDYALALEGDISKEADADYSEAIVKLSQQQTAYQAALQSAGAVMNLSLLSFLR